MNDKLRIMGPIVIVGLLLTACTTTGSNKAVGAPITTNSAATAVVMPMPYAVIPTRDQLYTGTYFSLHYPSELSFYENERPSADGVMAPLPNSIALQDSSFLLTITTFDLAPGTSLADFIDGHVDCLEVDSGGGQPSSLSNLEAKLYPDTACGLSGITYLFAIQDSTGYRLAIESSDAFAVLQPAVQPILDSFKALDALSSSTQVEHNGISLSYDPIVLGDVNIQDVPASANQGMFDQPSPAHTWIGFVPTGIVRDISNHWVLSREPQVIVFNLHDFGSFAPADEQARQKIAAFQQIMAEQPSAFNDEVPVLPLVNAAQSIRARAQWLEFTNGIGVRFVTAYSQDTLPVTNDRLVYIFYGFTSDGLHGVTAVFPINAAGLPETVPSMNDEAFARFRQNYAAEMRVVTDQLNNQPDSDFNPRLSQLDALVQSITIMPNETDYMLSAVIPQNAQLVIDSDLFNTPVGGTIIDHLTAGDPVVINGQSVDSRRSRILCADGTTASCWLPSDAVQITAVDAPVPGISGGLVDDQVVQIQAAVENDVLAGPSETDTLLGRLLAGEVAEVFATDESGNWYNIACPRNIGESCWVTADTAVNEPIGFFSSDG